MAGTERIVIKKGDDVATVVERLIDADAATVIIEMPAGALFGQNTTNMKLLKREAALLNREVVIESVDEQIKERAVRAGLGIGESLATIEAIEEPEKKQKAKRTRSVRVAVVSDAESPTVRPRARKSAKAVEPTEEPSQPENTEEESAATFIRPPRVGREPVRPKKGVLTKNIKLFSVAGVLALGIVVYVALAVLPEATITITAKKQAWNFDGQIVVDKSLARIDPVGNRVPGQVFVIKESVTKRVPATGTQFVSKKASGIITIYNAYSSQPQNIVANTRFVTPSGIVFRITTGLVIPGAKIENGKIIPSSIDTQVVADKPGEAGNVGPIAKLTIPGFAKTPKFEGFYGVLKEGTAGGFVGNTSVPTEKDLAAAKTEGFAAVSALLQSKQQSAVSEGFTVLSGASAITLTRHTVESAADASGTVGVTTEAQYSVLAFREDDMKALLQSKVRAAVGQEFAIQEDVLTYGTLNPKTVALSGGRMSVPTKYDVGLAHVIDTEAVKKNIAGAREQELGERISSVVGVESALAELWPFYVRSVPEDVEKINLVIN